MKTTTLIITIMILITSIGCKKESTVPKTPEKTIAVNLSRPDTLIKYIFAYSFGYFGDEESIKIIQQAKHSSSSEIKNELWEERIFEYQVQNNFYGRDTVIIQTQKGSDGAGKPNLINNTIFIFMNKW